jgi:hypothetical protein
VLFGGTGDQAGLSGCDSGQVFIEDSEDLAIYRSLRLGAECAQVGCTERIGILMQEIGRLSNTGACGWKVAAAQFGGGKANQDEHALPAWDWTGLVE